MKHFNYLLILVISLFITSCGQNTIRSEKAKNGSELLSEKQGDERSFKVTFVELGSVKCIPCQQMQPVMKSIETKYGKEVKVDFHDVWTEAGKSYGVKFRIEAIPTQVFLDETGKEFYRHVGYFPEEELVKVLQMKGVKMN